jgi:hypothetical protein
LALALGGGHRLVVADEPAVVGFMASGGGVETTFDLADGVDELPGKGATGGRGFDECHEFVVIHRHLIV